MIAMPKRELSVPIQLGGVVDVSSGGLSEDGFCSSTPVQGPSCPVSSSSGERRAPSRRSREKNEQNLTGTQQLWSEDSGLVGNDFVDSSSAMGHDARGGFRNQDAIHRRVSSPHSEGVSKRSNKPQMERRRRQRINESFSELKKCISEVFKVDPARYDKLEKAEILEMTVRFFHYIQSRCIIDSGTPCVEKKPVNIEPKNTLLDSYNVVGCKDSGFSDKCIGSQNEQPLTLIIQTISPNVHSQSSAKDPAVVGFSSSNHMGVPASVLSNNSPVIQLNITNNITKPQGETIQLSTFSPSGENAPSCFALPDTTTKDYHCDYSVPFAESCSELPINCETYFNNSHCVFPDQNQSLSVARLQKQSQCLTARESLPNRTLSQNACRPIAPKPPKRNQNNLARHADHQVNSRRPEPPEEVWRPWDANRKILKPHLVR